MKAASFEFVRARSVSEATQLLAQAGTDARVIAGGQSLGPMLNLRLARPRLVIDITGIRELSHIEGADDCVTLGACVTTANIEDGKLPGRGLASLPEVAMRIGYRAVRNRGTVGGSLCHADPAADWVTVLCALGAQCTVAGVNGTRCVAADQFVTGAYATVLAPSEILQAISLPRLPPRGRLGYCKICRKAGEFALAMAAVMHDPERGQLRMVVGATQGAPIIMHNGSNYLRERKLIDAAALGPLLARSGISDPAAQRQQLTALSRACNSAMQP
jgi:carbon-monoxide dehydrogenase medium subunit